MSVVYGGLIRTYGIPLAWDIVDVGLQLLVAALGCCDLLGRQIFACGNAVVEESLPTAAAFASEPTGHV
jgi:hypothetical protein